MRDFSGEHKIKKYLDNSKRKIFWYGKVSSTNTLLKKAADKGIADGTVIIADSQTEGKGRLDRSFYSPAGTGIYMSILLRNQFTNPACITAAAGVAVCRVLSRAFGLNTGIKWVNDIYSEGKKICGILAESSSENGKIYTVLGIGINLFYPKGGWPEELQNTAGCVSEAYNQNIQESIIAYIITEIDSIRSLPVKAWIDEYRRLSITVGNDITIDNGNTVREAFAEKINDDCSLAVKYPDGTKSNITYGDVRQSKKISKTAKNQNTAI